MSWPDRRILDLFGLERPILQAPMAGASGLDMALAVSRAGGLGALPCALLSPQDALAQVRAFRAATSAPLNLNFFCHRPPPQDEVAQARWREVLAPYYLELGLDPNKAPAAAGRAPFDADFAAVVEETRPEVISFHFGLPDESLLRRVKSAGARVISSATTVAEARWLAARGCDAVIAMGTEAGGHRGSFLTTDMAAQPGTFALVPQVVDAVDIPVIAAGGVTDGRGVAAALVLGASAVQVGSAYLRSPEAMITPAHRQALEQASDDSTAITNVFTGRPARGLYNRLLVEIGPMSNAAPSFPTAAGALVPLRAAAPDAFASLWAGQAAALARAESTETITRRLGAEALDRLAGLALRS